MTPHVKHFVSNSNGWVLNFVDTDMYREYKLACKALDMQFYLKIRAKYGVWAGNQNRFVASREELNRFDGTVMEDALLERDKYVNAEHEAALIAAREEGRMQGREEAKDVCMNAFRECLLPARPAEVPVPDRVQPKDTPVKVSAAKAPPRGQMVIRECANCNNAFKARAADVARGWGLFCSKACKTQHGQKRRPE